MKRATEVFIRLSKAMPVIAALLLVAACAQPSRVSQMTVQSVIAPTVAENQELVGAMFVADVSGGKATSPLWTSQVDNPQFKEALERSLEFNGLLANDEKESKLSVSAALIKLEQPLMGFSLTVTPEVQYRVVERATQTEILRETLVTPYTAEFGSSLIAVERLRLANEGAIRESIKAFLVKFAQSWSARTGRRPAAPAVETKPNS